MKNAAIATDQVRPRPLDSITWEIAIAPPAISAIGASTRFGAYAENANVLGVAWSSRYLTLFKDRLDEACSSDLGILSQPTCDEAVGAVWLHELGHVIGLVNNGLTMQTPHQDTENGRHDHSQDCIMYWAYETPSLISRLQDDVSGAPALSFDANCLADIAAVRDR